MATEPFQTSRRAINCTRNQAFSARASCSLVSFSSHSSSSWPRLFYFGARPPDEVGGLGCGSCGDRRDADSLWRRRPGLWSFSKVNSGTAAAPCKEGNSVKEARVGPRLSKRAMLITRTGENSGTVSSCVSGNASIAQPTSTLYSHNVISHWLVDKHGPMLSVKQNSCAGLHLGDK